MSLDSWRARRVSAPLAAILLTHLAAACGRETPSPLLGGRACQLPRLKVHIAVDRSGSLNSVWTRRARENLAAAIHSIPDGAILHLDMFTTEVQRHGPWTVDPGRVPLRDSVLGAMTERIVGDNTDIYAMADVLARRIAADSASKHIVFFVSDEKQMPPTSRVNPDSVRAAWNALRRRFGPERLRVVSIRVGTDPDSVFSRVAGVQRSDTASIPRVGEVVERAIAGDPLVAQLRRERENALVTATLQPATPKLGHAGGEVTIRLRSAARCGVYRLDDGTEIRPGGEAIVRRRVDSGISLVDALLLRRAPAGDTRTLIPAAALPRVVGYVSQGDTTQVTVFPAGGVPQRPTGRIHFARLWWPHALLLAAVALGTWLMLPPRGGKLSTTPASSPPDEDVELGPARRGKEVLAPEEAAKPWIAVRLARRSRLLPPTRPRLVVSVLREEPVTVAREVKGNDLLVVTRHQAGDRVVLDGPAFLLWPARTSAPPERMDEDLAGNFPGFYWKPRS